MIAFGEKPKFGNNLNGENDRQNQISPVFSTNPRRRSRLQSDEGLKMSKLKQGNGEQQSHRSENIIRANEPMEVKCNIEYHRTSAIGYCLV
ncbi:hypothetical protein T4D_2432 [Trichinella pseudospiralis]|uniref:Uncharacterized protein n=1 Tax=Trichinella pseudospiralis TaxID=6337 RepID=A0A0V1G022_TRIPS|nr:hypothetical protein T4D_2432 [Trichinella pseudospiralis]